MRSTHFAQDQPPHKLSILHHNLLICSSRYPELHSFFMYYFYPFHILYVGRSLLELYNILLFSSLLGMAILLFSGIVCCWSCSSLRRCRASSCREQSIGSDLAFLKYICFPFCNLKIKNLKNLHLNICKCSKAVLFYYSNSTRINIV